MADDLEDVKKALELESSKYSDLIPPRESAVSKYVLTPFGKILDVLDTDLNAVTQGLRPIVTAANPKLNEVYDQKGFNTVPSDLIEKQFEDQPGNKILSKILGFGADVALSPTTYIAGVGALTKGGKLFTKISSLKNAGQAIALDSKIAKEIAKHYGVSKITPALIGRAVKESANIEVASLEQQAKMGQRALINIGVPFTKNEIPLLRSELFFRGVDKSTEAFKKSKFGEVFHNLFSTSSGNPKFDRVRQALVSLLKYKNENTQELAVNIGKAADSFAKESGLKREEAFKMISDIVENEFRGDISAKSLIDVFHTNIEKQLVNGFKIERIIDKLPNVHSMTMDERGKLFNGLIRIAKEKQAGFDVFTTGFAQLPEEVRTVFIKEWTNGIGMKFAKDIKGKNFIYSDFADVIKAFNKGIKYKGVKIEAGEDAALFALIGKDEYTRIKGIEAQLEATNKALGVPSSVPGSTEGALLRDIVHRVRAHVDQGFSTAYTLFKSSPEYLKKINPRLHKLMNLIDSRDDWKITSLVDQFKVPLELAKKHPKAFDLAQEIRLFMQNQLQIEKDAGVPVREFIGNINYLPHIPVKEVREMLAKKYGDFSGGARQWNMDHVNTLQRKLRNINARAVEELFNTGEITKGQRKALLGPNGVAYSEELQKLKKWSDAKTSKVYKYLTVSQVNKLAQEGNLNILGKGTKVPRFFEENPASQILVRGIRGNKAVVSADFYEAARQFGKLHMINTPLPEGMSYVKNPNANPLAKIDKGEALIFDKQIAKHIDQLHEALTLPPDVHPLLKVFDGFQSEWKAWTLSIFPAYHIRNFVGNLWNNYLAGIHTPEPYIKALNIQKGKKLLIEAGNGQKYTGAQILLEAKKKGLINTGQYFGDIEQFFEAELKSGVGKLYKKTARVPISAGLKVGNYIENNSKLALFIRRIEEGHSFESAAMEVKKYLFDYQDLTVTERDFLRRVFPFFTWTRKNVPLQLEALLTHPQRLMTVAKAKNALESNYDGVPDERLLPDWYVQNFPIRVRYDKGAKQFQYFLLNNWLPAADIDKIFDPPTWIKNQLTPLMKEPIQQLANRDFFTNREIDRGDEYQTLKIFGMTINRPAREIHALKNIRLLTEIDRLSSADVPTSEKIGRAVTGKLYGFDEKEARKFEGIKYRDKKSRLRSALKKAIKNGNEGEQNRIRKELQKLRENKSK